MCFRVILPISAPQNMLAYGPDTFYRQTVHASGYIADCYWLPLGARTFRNIVAMDQRFIDSSASSL